MIPIEDELIKLLEENKIDIPKNINNVVDPTGRLQVQIDASNDTIDSCIKLIREYFKNKYVIKMNRGDQMAIFLSPELFENFITCCSQIPDVKKTMPTIETINIDPVEGSDVGIFIGQMDKDTVQFNEEAVMFLISADKNDPGQIVTKSNIINLANYSPEVKNYGIIKEVNDQINKMITDNATVVVDDQFIETHRPE